MSNGEMLIISFIGLIWIVIHLHIIYKASKEEE